MTTPAPGTVLDDFRLGELLHTGGMAQIYSVDYADGRAAPFPMVMKLPRMAPGDGAETIVSFEVEHQIMQALNGPHVPRLVAVVEAKRASKNVSGDIEQAKRYARAAIGDGGELPDAQWQGKYRVPFVYATNGRPFQRQYLQASGIWSCDLRRAQNISKPLEGWHTPTGITELL